MIEDKLPNAEEVLFELFGVENKIKMMQTEFIGLGAQRTIQQAMHEYAKRVLEKANARIAELEKEIERLKYWINEKDEEADTERVSIAVAEIESEFQQATKEQEKEWFSAGGMAERIIWKDKVEELEKRLAEMEKERDEFAIEFFLWLNNTWSGYVIAPYRGYVLFAANWLKIDALQKKIDNGDTNGLSSIEQLVEQFKASK